MNKWIQHLKDFASYYKISYREALQHPGCKTSYKKEKGQLSGSGNCQGTINMVHDIYSSEILGPVLQDIFTLETRYGSFLINREKTINFF